MLHKLSEQPHTGYSLCKEIAKSTGQRPSFGSIYPMLERLRKDGFVHVRQEGRKKVYTLTQSGKKQEENLKSHREQLIEEMIGHCRVMSDLIGEDPEPIVNLYERLKKGDDPLAPVKKDLLRVRNLIFTMSHDGRLKKHSAEINQMLQDMHHKMERMK